MRGRVPSLFEHHGVCWAPYRTMREVVEKDPDCSEQNPMFARVEQPGIGAFLVLSLIHISEPRDS